MTLSYLARLLCLCLACFLVLHLAAGAVVALFARPALRAAERRRPRAAARLLLTLRLLPAALALLVVVTLCVPSYLRLEPSASSGEEVGFALLAAALAGGVLWGRSMARALAASIRSWRYLRECRRTASLRRVCGRAVWVMEGPGAQLMLAGLVRSRILISRRVAEALPDAQLDAALRHESAHGAARDNLKRFCLLLAPGCFPFSRALEDAWVRASEFAADDRAVAGDPERSVSLAEALVAVARMAPAESPALATGLLAGTRHLADRVDRLLASIPPADEPASAGTLWTAATAVLAASPLLVIAQPEALASVHSLLERLAH